ncbi:hypothetical protein AVEN_254301-1 [Araneus ventricosus]|uniref:Uncharacterized protein n=1 Tax=Araneus ventricosus TaxID=182803 RepID=A0A4Y2FFT7_ARAVE|nr:hypothetical protein AVEN_254301-1 [Araneus ventricosus]
MRGKSRRSRTNSQVTLSILLLIAKSPCSAIHRQEGETKCDCHNGPYTAVPNWNFWNTGRENLSSRAKAYKNWSKWIGSGGIPKNSKSKTPFSDSNLGPRCEGSGRTKELPTLASRVEARRVRGILRL